MRDPAMNHISSRTGIPACEIASRVEECLEQGMTKAEIFRNLISGYGRPKAHISGETELELKKGNKFRQLKVSSRRQHRGRI